MTRLSMTVKELLLYVYMLEYHHEYYECFILSDNKPYNEQLHELLQPGNWNSEVDFQF